MFIVQCLPLEWPFGLLLEPQPATYAEWARRPEFQVPLAFGLALLLVLFLVKLPDLASWYRGRNKEVLDPVAMEELAHGPQVVIIDLRPPELFNGPKGHLPGAFNMPIQMLTRRIGEVAKDKRQLVVLVDASDAVSHRAAPLLKAEGYIWVRVLKGGMRAWRARDLPLAFSGSKR